MKILFDSEEMKEWCSGCKGYHIHFVGKNDTRQPVFKCKNCGRLTAWIGGDSEQVITPGNPPVGV